MKLVFFLCELWRVSLGCSSIQISLIKYILKSIFITGLWQRNGLDVMLKRWYKNAKINYYAYNRNLCIHSCTTLFERVTGFSFKRRQGSLGLCEMGEKKTQFTEFQIYNSLLDQREESKIQIHLFQVLHSCIIRHN